MYPAPADSSIAFHCKTGHELSLVELLQAQSAAINGGLEVLLAEWEKKHQTLLRTVEDARKNGYLDVAEIFNRHAKSLESRIRKVREAFSHSDSTALVKVPDIIRTA